MQKSEGGSLLCQELKVKRFEFMKENLDKSKISTMCRMLKVKRSGFYAWQRRPKSKRKIENEALLEKIKEIF